MSDDTHHSAVAQAMLAPTVPARGPHTEPGSTGDLSIHTAPVKPTVRDMGDRG
jgi:hypothetical protein